MRDARGVELVFPRPVSRIVCLLESSLSTLYMLGAGETLVGVPADAVRGEVGRRYAALDPRIAQRQLPTPGNWDFVNLETVLALRPDLVLLWASQVESVAALEQRGIRVYGIEIRSVRDVHQVVQDLGALTGRAARAAELLDWVRGEICAIRAEKPPVGGPAPRVYFMWPQSPLDTAGRASIVHEVLEMIGVVNVCPAEREHVVVRMEDILAWRPDVIVIWPSNFSLKDLVVRSGWRDVPAVRNGRVHVLSSPFWCDLWTLKYVYAAREIAAACEGAGANLAELNAHLRRILCALYGDRANAWFR